MKPVRIAYRTPGGAIFSVRCRDASDDVGRLLTEHYNLRELAEYLVLGGDILMLRSSVARTLRDVAGPNPPGQPPRLSAGLPHLMERLEAGFEAVFYFDRGEWRRLNRGSAWSTPARPSNFSLGSAQR